MKLLKDKELCDKAESITKNSMKILAQLPRVGLITYLGTLI